MTTTYIAGADGTDSGAAAVRFAHALAAVTGAEVVESTIGPETEPAAGLHALAKQHDAELLVVGTTHRGTVRRAVPGSVGERLLHGAPCPVVAVPADWRGDGGTGPVRLDRIALAYDDREPAKEALRYATRLAREHGARLEILSVFEPVLAPYAGGIPPVDDRVNDELREQLHTELSRVLATLPVELNAEVRLLDGPVAPALGQAAEGADLLVTGSRGLGPLRAVLVGAVSRHLVDHAPCPVLVVPRGVAVPTA